MYINKIKLLAFLIIFLVSNVYTNVMVAQDMRASLFSEVDKVLQQADSLQANLLSPDNYENGMERYQEAERALQKGDNLQDIRRKLDEAVRYFNDAKEATKLAEVTFSSVLLARNNAIKVQAAQLAADKWEDAEDEFRGAAEELEKGDARDAKEEGANAEELYREAELIAIKSSVLGTARSLLEEADRNRADRRVPKSVDSAEQLVREAENMLDENRYDTLAAKEIAEKAEYEARHALYLHRYIDELNRNDRSRENVVLLLEEPLKKISENLEITAEFDKGYDYVANTINDYVNNQINMLNDSVAQQRQEIVSLTQENQILENEIAELRSNLDNLSDERTQISQRVEEMSQFRERFNTVNNLFSEDEARVIRDQNDAVIRLVGLNFDVGSSVIKREHFALLTKVRRAIDTFPGSNVVIEGHTDSQGSEEVNQKLSQDRANAVMSYLLANMEIEPLRVEAIGFGESSPIANNETVQGRTLNRRIDIIIKPRTL